MCNSEFMNREKNMKKIVIMLTVFVLVFAFFQLSKPNPVNAMKPTPSEVPAIAPSTWTGGEEVSVDLTKYPAPDWLELKSQGVLVSTPGKICHEFRGINFHWVPEVRQLKDGKWVKIASTGSWVPSTEGTYVVCANAKTAGTYALFAFYNGPTEYETVATEEPIG